MRLHPHRLGQNDYTGRYCYFLTICAYSRRQYFVDPETVDLVRSQFLHTSAGESFAVLAYCMMPDHFHAVVEGQHEHADFARFVRVSKQRAGYYFVRKTGERLWQDSYFDRTLRSEESLPDVIRYVINNPLRAGLVPSPLDYPHWGSGVCSREELLEFIAAEEIPRV